MTDASPPPTNPPADIPPKPATQSEMLFTAVVALLMVGIIAMLAVLWYRERSARQGAEAELATIQSTIGQMLSKGPMPGASAGVRPHEVLGQRDVKAGTTLSVTVISTDAGERLGLLPGDLLLVDAAKPTSASEGN